MAPVNRVLSKISKFASKKQVTDIKSLILSGLGSGAFEGFQELGSQIASNAIERGIYNENLAVDDSLYNAFTSDEFTLGASVGFLADVVLSSAAIRRRGIVKKMSELLLVKRLYPNFKLKRLKVQNKERKKSKD